MKKIKEGDVYYFNWTTDYIKRNKTYEGSLRHCIEGMIVAKKINGKMYLIDTYWGVNNTRGRSFELKDISKDIEIEYYCNLNEIEKPKESEPERYYREEDIITLHDQHSCHKSCIYKYIKKGAKRNKEVMINYLNEQILEKERKIDYAKDEIEYCKTKIEKIKKGDIDIYL